MDAVLCFSSVDFQKRWPLAPVWHLSTFLSRAFRFNFEGDRIVIGGSRKMKQVRVRDLENWEPQNSMGFSTKIILFSVVNDRVSVGRSPSTNPLQTFSPNRPRVFGRCFGVSWNFLEGNEILVCKGKSGNYHPNIPGFFQWLDNNSETVRFQKWKPLILFSIP